ncbi:MAG: hypothetical protein OEV93_03800 [Candidatus Moranbacteria bacterium]|nr:hypothetical protein [Candidatus Moranbacteria bacterium]
MKGYKNLGGNSNVLAYDAGDDYIDVSFRVSSDFGYSNYRYTYGSAGKANVEKMKELAQKGQGLQTFINDVVRTKYSKKW